MNAAKVGKRKSEQSKGANYNETPNSIIWFKPSMVIDREYLDGHMDIKSLNRHEVFVEENWNRTLMCRERSDYSLSVPPSAGVVADVRPSLSTETGGIVSTIVYCVHKSF